MLGQRPIVTNKLIDPNTVQALSKSGVFTSQEVDLRQIGQDGIFSLQYTFTGSGVITWSYTVCSTSGGTYFTPSGAADIATSTTEGTDGVSFEPEMFPFMKIVGTETGTNTASLVSLYLNVQ